MEYLSLSETIRDKIHGAIKLSKVEMEIIDHPLFQRLHSIKQNGLLYLVFPSSTHTRFEHSIGVLDIADSIYRSLIRNAYVASEKMTPAVADKDKADHGTAVTFNETDKSLLADSLRIARYAALVHDIGHGPFSHHFDAFAPRRKQIGQNVQNNDIQSFIKTITSRREGRIEHEEVSCIMFKKIWDDIEDKEYVNDQDNYKKEEVPFLVAAAVLSRPELIGVDHPLYEFMPLLNDMVASAPADADRMDYLERDSRSAGVTYGLYDRERLLKSFLVYRGRDESSEADILRLGIKRSGLRAVENFVQARFELFVQVYYHKTNRAIQLMLESVAKIAKDGGVSVLDIFSDNKTVFEVYKNLTDETFLEVISGKNESMKLPQFDGLDKMNRIANNIFERKLWKRIYESDPETIQSIFKNLTEEYDNITIDEKDPKATKDLEDGADLLIRTDSDRYEAVGHTNWLEASSIIKALSDDENGITRIYFRGTDSDTQKDLRKTARSLALN